MASYHLKRNRGISFRHPLILVLLLAFVGLLGACSASSTAEPSHPSGSTPTSTPTKKLKGMITEFSVSTPNNQLGDITAGPDGAAWFTELIPNAQNGSVTITGKIERITPAGHISEFPLSSNSYARGITAGPDGNLWFTGSPKLSPIYKAAISPARSGASPRLATLASSQFQHAATCWASRRDPMATSGLPNSRAARSGASLLRA